MAEEEKVLPVEETEVKSAFQIVKESWYDKVPLTLKQLDGIIVAWWVLLGLTAVFIVLDAMDLFDLFALFR